MIMYAGDVVSPYLTNYDVTTAKPEDVFSVVTSGEDTRSLVYLVCGIDSHRLCFLDCGVSDCGRYQAAENLLRCLELRLTEHVEPHYGNARGD